MEVYKYHSNITQKRHGASRNYRYVLDVSPAPFLCSQNKLARRLEFQHPRLPDSRRIGSSTMSGSNRQGQWMPSSVTEEDVSWLREARYLTNEIPHSLPAQGQA